MLSFELNGKIVETADDSNMPLLWYLRDEANAVLHGKITLKNGRVEQSNFHDYQLLRLNEMPKIEVHIMPSAERPTGIGEPGVPPVGPALANALAAATGKRLRTLPLTLG